MCTSGGHMSTSFNKSYDHSSWQTWTNSMVIELILSISWKMLTKNLDVLVFTQNWKNQHVWLVKKKVKAKWVELNTQAQTRN